MTESTNVIQVTCPNCNAQPGQPCTVPGVGARSNGRRPVAWVHHSREDVALEADMEAGRTADSDRLNRSTNVADDDVWHDSRGVVWSSASAALQDFIDDLPSMDEDQSENVFQFTRHDAPAAFNLAAIAHGIDYSGLSDLFESYPVPKPGNYVVPSVNKDNGSLDPVIWRKIITLGDVAEAAADLRSERGENPEYDRALTEVICSFIEGGSDYHEDVEHYLSTLNEGDKK